MSSFFKTILTQKFWLIIALLFVAVFVFGEMTGRRLFAGTATEQWKPQGNNSQNNSLHHK